MTDYKAGTPVFWKWGSGKGKGIIKAIYHEAVTKEIHGFLVTRHGSRENPAYWIEQEKGTHVLKLHSEVFT